MDEITIIGLDLAKRVFQAHGAYRDGSPAFRKKLSRSQLVPFLAAQPRCIVAMEACASAHFWGRAVRELGHEVRLIPPIYVKPFVKLCPPCHNFTYGRTYWRLRWPRMSL